jgi:hypothetical protein
MSREEVRSVIHSAIAYGENVQAECMSIMNSYSAGELLKKTLISNARRFFELSCKFISLSSRENMENELEYQIKLTLITLDMPRRYGAWVDAVKPLKDAYLAALYGWYKQITNTTFQLNWPAGSHEAPHDTLSGTLSFKLLSSLDYRWRGYETGRLLDSHSDCIHELEDTKIRYFKMVNGFKEAHGGEWRAIYRLTDILFTISSYPQTRCS